MLESCPTATDEIQLTDDDLECSDILRMLLDLVCGDPFTQFDDLNIFDVIKLIKLADKYECAMALQLLALLTAKDPTLVYDGISLERFFYACALGDIETAYHYFIDAATTIWTQSMLRNLDSSKRGIGPGFSVEGAEALDTTAMGSHFVDVLPRKCFLSLLRANRLRLGDEPASWDRVADDWKMQMGCFGGSPHTFSGQCHLA